MTATLDDARCRDGRADDWFSSDRNVQIAARRECIKCPAIRACAKAALDAEVTTVGIWASIPISWGGGIYKQRRLLEAIAAGATPPDPSPRATKSDLDRASVLYMLARGWSRRDIAAELGISATRVYEHMQSAVAS